MNCKGYKISVIFFFFFFYRNEITKNMFYCKLNKGEFIFKQGDDANSYFIIGNFFYFYIKFHNLKIFCK